MFSLPSLAPQDVRTTFLFVSLANTSKSHTLWYTSSTSNHSNPYLESTENDLPGHPRSHTNPQHRRNALQRTPLSRLRQDEEYMDRRKQNIQNYGNAWIKPPGVSKTLYQQREEDREMKEHQEALRREQLAQELADAEAEGQDEMLTGEDGDGEMEEVRDLDDDIPDADNTAVEDEETDGSDEENETEEVPRNILAARVPDDVYREAIVRGEEFRSGQLGEDGGHDEEEDHSGMLQEEDLVHENVEHHDEDMDMDADLDADIPEAEAGGYEHTDTEDELSSSDDESVDPRHLPPRFAASSMVRSDGTQNSMDRSSILSPHSSQVSSSSPRQPRVSARGRGWRVD
jgi:hypothetical protein